MQKVFDRKVIIITPHKVMLYVEGRQPISSMGISGD